MARQTSFAHQRAVLEQFSSLLTGFESEFQSVIQKYEQSISALYEDHGLMEEIYEDYKNLYLDPKKAALTNLLSRIQEEDVPFIEKELDFISSR
ncbi:hypothetical protein FACS189474_3930 [Bacteroidia bacterium]|nr:hypothetical protein FACS189474_3930 [Bacteroidia bacterium]